MKNLFIFLITFISIQSLLMGNGVAIVDGSQNVYMTLLESTVDVQIQNQVATTTTTQWFKNNQLTGTTIKYAFPLHEEASAIKLRWFLDGIWYTASFSAQPQDTTLPGNGPSNELLNYLGNNPFYFDLETLIPVHSVFAIELTYVELLPYQLSRVDYFYPNDYSLIQISPVLSQEFSLSIQSQRKIETLDMTSHSGATILNNDYDATLTWELLNQPADQDIEVYYKLDPDELGLFGFSTYYGNIQNPCDSAGNGFFGFIVEPDAGDSSNTIPKVFTLIIDRSGSMSGNKISQARDAASYIVDHLNVGDKFNIVDFESQATSFQPDHVDYTPTNRLNALNYISNISSGGGTNISNAFSVAVPQFANEDSNAAKIVIFFTDGLDGPTQDIINHVNQLTAQYQPELNIFTLGIGANVNRDLLTQLATQHYGLAEFLDNQDLAQTISNFYLTIQNPVLTNISLAFSASTVSEVFPVQLPNLYKGRQLMVVGRYQHPDSGQVTLSGTNQLNVQQYSYPLVLTDSFIEGNKFLVKLWAKKKIESLMGDYFALLPDSAAELVKEEVIDISLCYQVVSPFTSLSSNSGGNGNTTSVEEELDHSSSMMSIKAFPNPFSDQIQFAITVKAEVMDWVEIRVFDIQGKLVKTLKLYVGQRGDYAVEWNGNDSNGNEVPAGQYLVQTLINGENLTGIIQKRAR